MSETPLFTNQLRYEDPRLGYICLRVDFNGNILTGPEPLVEYLMKETELGQVKTGYTIFHDTIEGGDPCHFIRSVSIVAKDNSNAAIARYNLETKQIEAVEVAPSQVAKEGKITVTSPYLEADFFREEKERNMERVESLLSLLDLSEKNDRAAIIKTCQKLWPAARLTDADQGVFVGKVHYRKKAEDEVTDLAMIAAENVIGNEEPSELSPEQRDKIFQVTQFFTDSMAFISELQSDDAVSELDKMFMVIAKMNQAKAVIKDAGDLIPPASAKRMNAELDGVIEFITGVLEQVFDADQPHDFLNGFPTVEGEPFYELDPTDIDMPIGADLSLTTHTLLSGGRDFMVDWHLQTLASEGEMATRLEVLDTYCTGAFIFESPTGHKFLGGESICRTDAVYFAHAGDTLAIARGELPIPSEDGVTYSPAYSVAESGLISDSTTEPESTETRSASILERFWTWVKG